MRKQTKRTFAVTRGQIFLALVMVVIAFTIIFEIGVSVGKKRMADAERKAAQRNDAALRSNEPVSDEGNTAKQPAAEENMQDKTAQQDNITRAAVDIPGGGDLPIEPPQDQPIEQPQTEKQTARYTIQVGVFSSRQNAENMVQLLKSYEYKSWLGSELSAERELYSVFVGRFSTRDEAKLFGESLQNRLSFVTGYIVRDIQEKVDDP